MPDEAADPVAGLLFESDRLPAHWERLDAFEGEGYERRVVRATRDDGSRVDAFVNALRGR